MIRTPLNTKPIYTDFRTDFSSHPATGDLALLTDEEAVKRSIKNICLTSPQERFWRPTFGAGLEAYLFEPINYITASLIKSAIEDAIANYEPRASVYEVYVAASPDENAYTATIVFSVINKENPITFSILLNRIR